MLVVTAQDWNEKRAELRLYERETNDSEWVAVREPIPVVLGKNGLAWGIGLHPTNDEMVYKEEGDGKSPAGFFSLGSAFGFSPDSAMRHLKMEYLPLRDSTEAVDDPLSCYYNYIVDREEIIPDWLSSEKMRKEPLYEIGVNILQNFPNPKANAGSAVFIHIWENENSGTEGCTAMAQSDLNRILFWLDREKNPILVQLPLSEYQALKNKWSLPSL